MLRLLRPALLLTLATATAAPALAASPADAPYTAKKASPSSLIQTASYDEPPIVFGFDLVQLRQVSDGPRLDFEHTFEIPFDMLVEQWEAAYLARTPVARANPNTLLSAKANEFILIGKMVAPGEARYTVGHPDAPFHFVVDVFPDGRRTKVTVRNMITAMTFSGVMPARTPFQPVGAKALPFKYN